MTEAKIGSTDASQAGNGQVGYSAFDWPRFPGLEHAERDIPRLYVPGAQTIARDRWERLVTSIDIPNAPEEIWRALTDPDRIKLWLAVCHGSLTQFQRDCILDFEDGEFFLCRTLEARQPNHLRYLWRWLGIGQATSVTWYLNQVDGGTRVTVTEEAINPPWDWQTWNGGGWPGILDQLAAYLRTGTEWRWPWRRVGPYAQVELPVPMYEAWDRLCSPSGLKYWLQTMRGNLAPEQALTILMGDASGMIEMVVREVVEPGQSLPSFLPSVAFSLRRQIWNAEIGGKLWIEPAGWGRSLLQVVHYNWESLPAALQLSERKILTGFWAGAVHRASLIFRRPEVMAGPHSW
jgi:uncharacterized protein YndB with AHSA1/START domain